MYDVTSGDKTTKTIGAVGAFLVLAPLSLFLMMWWDTAGTLL